MERNFFKAESEKSIREFIESLRENAPKFNFIVRHVLNMNEEYKKNGVDVDEGFKLFQIILCNPEKSYKTVKRNFETAAVLLPPKQFVVYDNKGVTVVNYLYFTKEFIAQALPNDEKLQNNLPNSCQRIIRLIEASI